MCPTADVRYLGPDATTYIGVLTGITVGSSSTGSANKCIMISNQGGTVISEWNDIASPTYYGTFATWGGATNQINGASLIFHRQQWVMSTCWIRAMRA